MAIKKLRVLVLGRAETQPADWLRKMRAEYPLDFEILEPQELLDPGANFPTHPYDLVILDTQGIEPKTGLQALNFIHQSEADLGLLVVDDWPGANAPDYGGYCGTYRTVWKSSHLDDLALNIRLGAEQTQKLRILRTLTEVSSWINATLDSDEILRRTCETAVRIFDVDHSGLVVFDEDQKCGWTVAEHPDDGERSAKGNLIQVAGAPIEEALVFEKKIQAIADVASADNLGPAREQLLGMGIRSILLCPVIVEERVIASFSLDMIIETRDFTQLEQELCALLANQAAIAIDNARRVQEARQGHQSLLALFHSTRGLLPTRPPHEVIQNVVENAHREMKGWRSLVMILNDDGSVADHAAAGYNMLTHVIQFRPYPEGITMQVFKTGEPRFVSDTHYAEQGVSYNPEMLADRVRAFACLPLPYKNRTIGVMWVQYNQIHRFTQMERGAHGLFAQYVAVTYESARRLHGFVRAATEAMEQVERVKAVRQTIADSARKVLDVDFALLWSNASDRCPAQPPAVAGLSTQDAEAFSQWFEHNGFFGVSLPGRNYVEITDLDVPSTPSDLVDTGYAPGQAFWQATQQAGARAVVGVRLLLDDGETLGGLLLGFTKALKFDPKDRTLVEEFANYAAITLKMSDAFEHAERVSEEYRRITQISAEGNLEKTLCQVVRQARELVKCDVATLYLYDESRRTFFDYIGDGNEDPSSLRPPDHLESDSSLTRMLTLPEPWHVAEQAGTDEIFNGEFVRLEHIQSSAGLRLCYGESVVGVMFVNFRKRHSFSEQDRQDLMQFGNSAAIAIHSYIKENERRHETGTALLRAGQAITERAGDGASPEETLTLLCLQALQTVRAEARGDECISHIALFDGRRLRFAAASDPAVLARLQEMIGEIDLVHGAAETPDDAPQNLIGIVGRAVVQGLTLRVNNAQRHPDYLEYDPRIRSQLSTPLRLGDQIIGVLTVEHRRRNAFNLQDQQNLELLGILAGMALVNNRRFSLLKGLIEAGQALTEQRGLREALHIIAGAARQVFGSDLITIYTYNEADRTVDFPAIFEGPLIKPDEFGLNTTLVAPRNQRLKVNDLFQGSVVRAMISHRSPIFALNSLEDAILGGGYFVRREEIISSAAIPLMIETTLVGLLFINYRREHKFTDEERLEISLFARYAAIAIEIARQHEELRIEKGMVGSRTALAWMGIMRSAWRNPIASYAINTKGSLVLLRSYLNKVDIPEETRQSIEEQFQILREDANHVLKLPLTPPLFTDARVDRIADINEFLRQKLLPAYQDEFRGRGVEPPNIHLILGQGPYPVEANEDWLNYAIRCLLDRALQANCEDAHIWIVTTATERTPERFVEISIQACRPTDAAGHVAGRLAGPGSPPAMKDELMTVQAVIQAYNGELHQGEADERTKGWTGGIVRVVLPLTPAN